MTKSSPLLAAVAAVAAAAAFYFLVLSPKRAEITKLDGEVAAAQTELMTSQQLVADYSAAKSGYRTAYASVVRLGKAVPVDDDVRSLVVQLDGAAKRSKVNFQSISVGGGDAGAAAATGPAAVGAGPKLPPGATVGPAGFPIMPFTFAFDGSFFRLSDFFRRLENFVTVANQRVGVTGRLLTIDSLTLSPTDFPKINAQVGATSFLVSPIEGLTAGASPQGPAGTLPQAASNAASAGNAASSAASTTATSTGAVR